MVFRLTDASCDAFAIAAAAEFAAHIESSPT